MRLRGLRKNVKILRHLLKAACTLVMVALAVSRGSADTPASHVSTQTVQATQTYPEVPANGEGWFDVGGFCKVVDVGSLSTFSPPASGIPVFVPGPTDQWENYRTSAPADYNGQLTLTTCCRPQTNIASLCTEAGATPVPVDRQYGKLDEVDSVSATCVDQWGKPYQDQVNVICSGDNGPDGQAQWVKFSPDSTSSCTANAFTSACTASCGGGTSTVYDSCGNVQAVNACNTQSCCTSNWVKSCSGPLATYSDIGSCHEPSYQINGGCYESQYSCSSYCFIGSHTTTVVSEIPSTGVVCETDYEDCATWYGSTAGGSNCTSQSAPASYTTTCTNGYYQYGNNNVPYEYDCICNTYN